MSVGVPADPVALAVPQTVGDTPLPVAEAVAVVSDVRVPDRVRAVVNDSDGELVRVVVPDGLFDRDATCVEEAVLVCSLESEVVGSLVKEGECVGVGGGVMVSVIVPESVALAGAVADTEKDLVPVGDTVREPESSIDSEVESDGVSDQSDTVACWVIVVESVTVTLGVADHVPELTMDVLLV